MLDFLAITDVEDLADGAWLVDQVIISLLPRPPT